MTAFSVLLLQFGPTTPAAAAADHDPSRYLVNRPGEVLFNRRARAALTGNPQRWARGQVLTKLEDRHEDTYYSLERTLLPTVVAHSPVRSDPQWDRGEQRRVERRLNRLVRLRGIKRPQETAELVSPMNNRRYLNDSVHMARGALHGNRAPCGEGYRGLAQA